MLHLDLFSGIGGFAIATEMVWENVEHIFCDNDEFCQQILKKHWPDSPTYGDINELIADTSSDRRSRRRQTIAVEKGYEAQSEYAGKLAGGFERPYLLTGGFPCQPFSQAGRRKGTADDRYLWPQMFAVIRNTQPEWIIAENVGGLVTWNNGLVLEQVCTDLESEGYEVQPFIIPAVAVNAPHRRDRVWVVARSNNGLSKREAESTQEYIRGKQLWNKFGAKNTNNWRKNWLEVATRLCRVDDGLPKRLDRNPRLKALGNAIVPQVAALIMETIKGGD